MPLRVPQPKSPGVYAVTLPPTSRPIEAAGTAVAAFLGFTEKGPYNQPVLCSNWTQFVKTFGGFKDDYFLPQSVFGYCLNGGGNFYIVRLPDGADQLPDPPAMVAGSFQGYQLVASNGKARKGLVRLEDWREERPEGSDEPGEPQSGVRITVVLDDNDPVVQNIPIPRGKPEVPPVREALTKLGIKVEAVPTEAQQVRGTVELKPPALPGRIDHRVYTGEGAKDERAGIDALDVCEDVTMVLCPDLMSAYLSKAVDETAVRAVQQRIVQNCKQFGRMAILDPLPGMRTPQQIKEWVLSAGYDSGFATMYWPMINVAHPSGRGTMLMPPSGHIAGVWGRSDAERGVFKAPANEGVVGALSLETEISRLEHDTLNEIGLNCLRRFPGSGIKIWGARTLARTETEWRYINVRRLFNYIQASIVNGTQWIVFEPNDEALWARIRRSINKFLITEWQRGALFGATPEQAFFVKCDAENNTAEDIENGNVIIDIGLAAVRPAEFVVFQLQQLPSGVTTVSE